MGIKLTYVSLKRCSRTVAPEGDEKPADAQLQTEGDQSRNAPQPFGFSEKLLCRPGGQDGADGILGWPPPAAGQVRKVGDVLILPHWTGELPGPTAGGSPQKVAARRGEREG